MIAFNPVSQGTRTPSRPTKNAPPQIHFAKRNRMSPAKIKGMPIGRGAILFQPGRMFVIVLRPCRCARTQSAPPCRGDSLPRKNQLYTEFAGNGYGELEGRAGPSMAFQHGDFVGVLKVGGRRGCPTPMRGDNVRPVVFSNLDM